MKSEKVQVPTNVVIRQIFNPSDRRVIVMNNGEEEFSSRVDGFGSFEDAAQYVMKNYGYTKEQIEVLRNDFEIDWDD